MPKPGGAVNKTRKRKQLIGAISVALLLAFTILAILGLISFVVWVVADLIVAAVANLLLRRLGRATL
ncbi:MAG: hypothetical protein NWE98_06245 [Candidatus Bathyarchaeota archaeon]|nr:hypothetical protein [Candidatus Bathyarchaeota archaeon]